MADLVGGEGEGWAEVGTAHIPQDGVAHLTGNGAAVQIVGDVHRGHDETAGEDIGLYEHTEFAGYVPGVDGLNRGLVVRGQFGEVHHLSAVEQFPPVEVGPVVRGEIAEEGVFAVYDGARGVGRLHLKPRGVPEDGQILLFHCCPVTHLTRCGEQHGAALAHGLYGFGGES